MKLKLKDYPKNKQQFVRWYKAKYWSIAGINSEHSDQLDIDDGNFTNETTALMWDAYQAGKRHEKEKGK